MAELALAIIPLGLKTCSGLVSYLAGLKDRDDALTRLTRQAESLEGTFRLFDDFLKRGQLDPATSQSAANALSCLKHCEDGLKDLRDFEQKLSSPIAPAKMQEKMKEGIRKLRYPLQQSQLEQLEKALDCLCTPLNLAVQNLQLELQVASSSVLVENTTRIQQTRDTVSSLSTAVGRLNGPISDIQSQLPLLQGSVNGFIPQINLAIQVQLQAQMEEIRLSLEKAESAALRRNVETNQLLSQLHFQNRNPAPAIYKLASKPSALASLAGSASACYCHARRLRTLKTLSLGPLQLADDIISEIPHFRDCNYYVANAKYSRTRALRFTGLTSLINRAIEVTFCTTMGAGGFSISPSFTYFAMVDEEKSPAFRVLLLLYKTAYITEWFDEPYEYKYFQAALRKFQDIFRSGKARPTDINSRGDTLLHVLIKVATIWCLPVSPSLEVLLDFFVAIGVSVSARDHTGLSPFYSAAKSPTLLQSIMTRLCVEDILMPLTSINMFPGCAAEEISRLYGENSRITEALFGPLGLAIIRNSTETVDQLINRCPECLEELSFYGESPFFMAISKPSIFKLLVEKASPEQLAQPGRRSRCEMTLLGQAMFISYDICKTRGTEDGSFCPCVASAKILLAVDYPIVPYRDFWEDGFNVFASASMHCKVLVADQLRMRRRRLRQIAQEKLLHSEYSTFCSSLAELDFLAIELDRLLSRKGLIDFGSLSTMLPNDLGDLSTGKHCFRPIYLDINNPEDAAIFRDLGFLDVSNAREYHWPSNFIPHGHRVGLSKVLSYLPLEYLIWLHDHCPGVWEWICQDNKLKESGFILADACGSRRHWSGGTIAPVKETESTVLALLTTDTTDGCTCQCSPGGCSPFALRMKWLADIFIRSTWDRAKFYQSYAAEHGKQFRLDHHVIMVRQATFEVLGMTHTCFDVANRKKCLEQDDIEFEIETEDVDKARCLDDLVMKFRDFMLANEETAQYETGSAADNGGHHPSDQCSVSHRRAVEFWGEVWPWAVDELQKRLEASWRPDYQALEDLGLSLWVGKEEEEDEDAETETSEDERNRLFDEFLEDLEMID